MHFSEDKVILLFKDRQRTTLCFAPVPGQFLKCFILPSQISPLTFSEWIAPPEQPLGGEPVGASERMHTLLALRSVPFQFPKSTKMIIVGVMMGSDNSP